MTPPVTVGVSLKMYFGHQQARNWFDEVAALLRSPAAASDAVADGAIELFVIPSYLGIQPALEAFAGTPVLVGAQDLATEDSGAYTGEVSGAEIAEVGARVVEVGHFERRRLFGDSDRIVAEKTAAALRNGLVPILCVGETNWGSPQEAASIVIAQLRDALVTADTGRVIVAYEPVWAIGASEPATAKHILHVGSALQEALSELPGRAGSSVIYGGSAGPGLLTQLDGAVDGLFLGRFAHDPAALASVLDEAAELVGRRAGASA